MDNFAEQAFKDALEQQADDELQAWMRFSDEQFMIAQSKVVENIGIGRMNALCRAARIAGASDTLAEYAHQLMMMAFHIGYKARREEER